jgi:hypothetical protein
VSALVVYLAGGYLYAICGVHETTMRYREKYAPDQTCLATVLFCVAVVTLIWPMILWTNRGWSWMEIPDYEVRP